MHGECVWYQKDEFINPRDREIAVSQDPINSFIVIHKAYPSGTPGGTGENFALSYETLVVDHLWTGSTTIQKAGNYSQLNVPKVYRGSNLIGLVKTVFPGKYDYESWSIVSSSRYSVPTPNNNNCCVM